MEQQPQRAAGLEQLSQAWQTTTVAVQVEVQQLKTNVPIRDAPREGHKSFISEEISQHKDTVGARHWMEAVAALNDSVQSLELVVLHRDTIVSILLQQAVPTAKISIPALLRVLTALSKDLQADFVPFCPRVFDHLAMLASSFVRDAQCLEAIFASVSSLLKNIHKHLQSKIPWIFRISRQLRYHSAHHVRVFAAEVCSPPSLLPMSQKLLVLTDKRVHLRCTPFDGKLLSSWHIYLELNSLTHFTVIEVATWRELLLHRLHPPTS